MATACIEKETRTLAGCACCGRGVCPKSDPPFRLLYAQMRPLTYWACLLGVSRYTVAREFEHELRAVRGRKLLARSAVERRYPGLTMAAVA